MDTVDAYIASFPAEVASLLVQLRALVRETAPGAEESMSYGMPAYKLNGRPLIYFAAFKKHIGLYATPSGNAAFAEELSNYKQGRGSVQFPLNEPLPFDLIARIVKYRVENP